MQAHHTGQAPVRGWEQGPAAPALYLPCVPPACQWPCCRDGAARHPRHARATPGPPPRSPAAGTRRTRPAGDSGAELVKRCVAGRAEAGPQRPAPRCVLRAVRAPHLQVPLVRKQGDSGQVFPCERLDCCCWTWWGASCAAVVNRGRRDHAGPQDVEAHSPRSRVVACRGQLKLRLVLERLDPAARRRRKGRRPRAPSAGAALRRRSTAAFRERITRQRTTRAGAASSAPRAPSAPRAACPIPSPRAP